MVDADLEKILKLTNPAGLVDGTPVIEERAAADEQRAAVDERRAAIGAGFTPAERAGGPGGAAQHPPEERK